MVGVRAYSHNVINFYYFFNLIHMCNLFLTTHYVSFIKYAKFII